MNSFQRFDEEKLPDRKCFYSSTSDERTDDDDDDDDDDGKKPGGHISFEDYLMCKNIWDVFGTRNVGDYHDHYLKKDVLLIADVFENFIDTCLKFYGLDPCHYFSSPRLSWDAMLKLIGIKLEKYLILKSTYWLKKG